MSDRRKPHKGRDVDGRYRVRQADVEALLEDPKGEDYVRDDVRLGGAVADVGPNAAQPAKHISDLIEENRYDVNRATGRSGRRKGSGRGHRR